MSDASARPQQLALDLPVEVRLGAEDFLVGPSNAQAFAMIEGWPAWPDKLLRLVGPAGSGKTHLAAIWALRAGARIVPAAGVTADAVQGLAGADALVIEDADQLPRDEHAMFHLVNAMRARGAFMLLTARSGAEMWGLATPDLLSRLRLSPAVFLDEPDDMLLRAVLVKLFFDRQVNVDATVVEALGRRMERSLATARRLVEKIDREALTHNRRITRQFALEALERWQETCQESGREIS